MAMPGRIAIDREVLGGKPIVRGTRIAVEMVIDLLARGWTPAKIAEEFPTVTEEDVLACLSYASDVLHGERVLPAPARGHAVSR